MWKRIALVAGLVAIVGLGGWLVGPAFAIGSAFSILFTLALARARHQAPTPAALVLSALLGGCGGTFAGSMFRIGAASPAIFGESFAASAAGHAVGDLVGITNAYGVADLDVDAVRSVAEKHLGPGPDDPPGESGACKKDGLVNAGKCIVNETFSPSPTPGFMKIGEVAPR